MNKFALLHRPKSEYAYAVDSKKLHILIRTAKNDLKKIDMIYGDPFSWDFNNPKKLSWNHHIKHMEIRYQTSMFDYYFIEIETTQKRVKYAFILHDGDDIYLYGTRHLTPIHDESELYRQYDLSDYFNFPFIHESDDFNTPKWVQDTVWYQIFPDRFYGHESNSKLTWGKLPVKNNELYGGNIKGVIEKLPYLHDLGVTGIYFTPLFEAPSAHKYDTTDYYKIDPQFGTLEDMKSLVRHAHKLNIKVMLDGVFNHAGYEHQFFQDVLKNNENSIYKNSFYIDKFPVGDTKDGLNYKAFAFAKNMPKWRTEDPHAEAYLLGCVKYWIETCDIDGWRLDVSNEVSHQFLRKVKEAARSVKKDVYILGENLDDSTPWLQGDQMDGVMNYDLAYPTWAYFQHRISLEEFRDTVIKYLAKTQKNVINHHFNLVGCHDTIRIKTRLDEDIRRVKLINLFMFTSAGTPNIYYGDEVGMSGQNDPDNRRCMLWNEKDQDLDFKSFMKTLIKLRATYHAFISPDYGFLDNEALIYTKESNNQKILVIMNNQDVSKTINLSKSLFGTYINLFTQEKVIIHDKITLEAYGYKLLLKEV